MTYRMRRPEILPNKILLLFLVTTPLSYCDNTTLDLNRTIYDVS